MARRPDLAFRSRTGTPTDSRSPGGAFATLALLVAGLLAVTAPLVATVTTVAGAGLVAALLGGRRALARVRARRRTGRARQVCVPAAGVCVEA